MFRRLIRPPFFSIVVLSAATALSACSGGNHTLPSAMPNASGALKLARLRGHLPLSGEGVPYGQKSLLPAGVPAEDR